MPVDAREEANLVRLTLQGHMNPMDQASDAPIIKTAFVGETRWKDEIFAFVAKPFRAFPIEYFETETAAREWLAT